MYKQIRRGPYAYLREWNLKRFWDMYWPWCLLGLVLLATGIAHNIRTGYLVENGHASSENLSKPKEIGRKGQTRAGKMASCKRLVLSVKCL